MKREKKAKSLAELEYPNRIRELREKENLTQEAFVEKGGMSIKMLSDWENGKTQLSSRFALEIAKIFGVSLDWLYGFDVKASSSIIEKIESIFRIHPFKFYNSYNLDTENPDYIEAFQIFIDRDFLTYLEMKKQLESGKKTLRRESIITKEELSQEFDGLCDALKKKLYDKIFDTELDPKKKEMVRLLAIPEPEQGEGLYNKEFEAVATLQKMTGESKE